VDSVVYGCTGGSDVRQYGSILTIARNDPFVSTARTDNNTNLTLTSPEKPT